MEAAIAVGLVLSVIIFVVGMIGGYIPLYREWGLDKLSLMVAFGGGTLLAAALFLMMPEGLHHLEEMLPHEQADLLAALSVTVGFLLMYMLENLILPRFALSHLDHAHEAATDTARRVSGLSVFVALGVHTLIDGIALGVAVTGGEGFALGGLVFVALISHHLPASFSLTSALKANQYPNSTAFLYLIIVNAMVPVGTVLAALALSGLSGAMLGAMLGFSAGTFIHVATSDLLPVIQRRQRGKALFFGVVVLGVVFMAGFGMLAHPH